MCLGDLGSTPPGRCGCSSRCSAARQAAEFPCRHKVCRDCLFSLLKAERTAAKCPLCRMALFAPDAAEQECIKPGGQPDGEQASGPADAPRQQLQLRGSLQQAQQLRRGEQQPEQAA